MIFKGNASSKAEGGEIKNAYIGVDGVAREAYKIFVGDESGKAQLVYWNNTPPETAVTVSSLEEFYEKATADPYGYYILEKGKYTIPEKNTDTWATIENFYGTLCSEGEAYLYTGGVLIKNNYGIIRNVGVHYSTSKNATHQGGNLVTNNYGHITHCNVCISLFSKAPMIGTHKTGAVLDNCNVLLQYNSIGEEIRGKNYTATPLIDNLEQGAYVYNCPINFNVYVEYVSSSYKVIKVFKPVAANPYSGYKDDPEADHYVFHINVKVCQSLWNARAVAYDGQRPFTKSYRLESSRTNIEHPMGVSSFDSNEWYKLGDGGWLRGMETMQNFCNEYNYND